MNDQPIINLDDAKKLFQTELTSLPPQPLVSIIEPSIREETAVSLKKESLWLIILFWIGMVVLAFVVGFLIINGPALAKKVYYIFHKKGVNSQEIFQPNVTVSEKVALATKESLPDNRLVIPKIGVDAPIVWEVEESQIKDKLLQGVVHYKNTSLPNQTGGNVFLTGHSSNYWWIKSNYNRVFALLSQLEANDKIALTYQQTKYVYEVYDKFVVKPTELEVIKPLEEATVLTLMTCVPIGTNFRRLIVRSKLLYSDQTVSKEVSPVEPEPSPQPTPTPLTTSNGLQPIEVTPTPQPTEIKPRPTPTDLLLPGF